MSGKNPEIITLSSDDESKPVDKKQPSKRKKVQVNTTSSKKRSVQSQSGCASKTETVYVPKPSVIPKNGTRTIELPLNKRKPQKDAIHNIVSSKLSPISPLQNSKNTNLCSAVSEKQIGNSKSTLNLQNKHKSLNSLQAHLRTSTPNNSVMNMRNSRTGNNLSVIQKSDEVRTEKSNNKTNIPFSVLSALREKGISITNVYDISRSNTVVCNKQLESQNYLDNLKYSLKKSDTNINVVPKTNSVSSFTGRVTKTNSVPQAYASCLKSSVKDCDFFNRNKYQNEKKVVGSTQSMSKKPLLDLPFKFGSEIKIIEKPPTVSNSVTLNKSSKFVPNSLQKSALCSTSVSCQQTKKDPVTDSLIQITSRRSLSITPVPNSKNNQCRSSFYAQIPGMNTKVADKSKQNKNALTMHFTSVHTPNNSAVSFQTVNSSVKCTSNFNTSKSSSDATAGRKSLLQSSIKNHIKTCKTKNIDVANDRKALLNFLSLCNSDNKEHPSYKKPSDTIDSAATILPLAYETSPCQSVTESSILCETMKLKDVPSKTQNWPKLIISLERLDALMKYTEKEITTSETVIEQFSLPETNDKLSNEWESVECERISEKCPDNHNHSLVMLNDNQLYSDKKAESCIILMNSIDTSIPTDDKDKNSVNLKNSQQYDCSVIETLKRNNDMKSINSSTHCAVSVDSVATLKQDSNNALGTVTSSDSNDPSQGIKMEIKHEDRSKNSDNYLTINENNDESKVKSIPSLNKSDMNNSHILNNDISNNSESIKMAENMDFCPEAFEITVTSVCSDVPPAVKSDIFHHENSNCSEKELEIEANRDFCPGNENFINSSNISESRSCIIKDLLNNIILKIENKEFEEIKTCTKVLNSIISTIEKGSNSSLTETENTADIQKSCQESIKNTQIKNFSDLLPDSVCKGIIRKEKFRPLSTAVYSAIENNPCVETCKENKEKKSLIFDALPSNMEKSDFFTVPNQVLEKKSIPKSLEESINVCDRIDVNTNLDIKTQLSIPFKESPKEIFNEMTFNLIDNKNKCTETEVISVESALKITKNGNRESLSFDHDIITEGTMVRLKSLNSECVNNDSEMDCEISDQITDNVSSESDNNIVKSLKNIAGFQDENAVFSSSPLHGNEGLSCIIVNVKSNCDLFLEEEQNLNSQNDSEFKQNVCVGEQDVDFNDKEPEPCVKLFSSEEDSRTSDKYSYTCTDDERENMLSQVHSTQVTSPKLSLKRKRNIESLDDEFQESKCEYSVKNGLKKFKTDQSALLDVGQKAQTSSDKNIVPCIKNKEEENRRKFLELLEYSKTLMDADSSEAEKEKIVKIMMKKLGETQPWYAGSENFSSQIDYTMIRLKRMEEHSGDDVFSILQNMRKEFKNYKGKSKVAIIKEISHDSNSASSSIKNDAVERNDSALCCHLTKETEINSNSKDSIIEMSHNSHLSSASESIMSEGRKFSTSNVNTDEKKDITSTLCNTVLTSETAKTSDFVNNVDKGSFNLESVSSSVAESSNLKKGITDNQFDSLAVPSTSGLSSTTDDTMYAVKNNINEKDVNPRSPYLSPLQLDLLDSHEPLDVKSSITDINTHLHQNSSTSELCSSVTQSIKLSSGISSKNLLPDKNCPNKKPSTQDGTKLYMSATIPANKIDHTISVLKSVSEVNSGSADDRSTRRIQKLERMLQKLDKKIKKLQERELSLDDLDNEDSVYIMEDRYKKRFQKVWETLCKAKKQPSRTGRIIEKKFKYEGSRYKEINAAVEKMINKRKTHEKFPDYIQMLTLIKQVNDSENIGLNERSVGVEAERVFSDVGKELQIRRCRDHEELFGCFLTDNYDPSNDPAEYDNELKEILLANDKKFEDSINQVIDSYAEKQTPEEEDNQDNNSSEDEEDQDEVDKDLPLTDPASPNLSDTSDLRNRKVDDDIIEINNESDKSTDPNEEIIIKKTDNQKDEQQPSTSGVSLVNFQNNKSTFIQSFDIEDSNSSG